MISLTTFLSALNIDLNLDSYKIHLATGNPLNAFFNDQFQEWQERQNKRNFPCKMVISLIELRRNTWLFVGVYKIIGDKKISDKHIQYSTELIKGQEELIGRIVVHHVRRGRAPYLKGKKEGKDFTICEILPKKMAIKNFPGHNSVQISYSELKTIIEQNLQTWHGALSNVKGVYLITDNKTGKLYVGSATGSAGLWQRWSDYAENGHGGNKELKALLKINTKEYKNNFQYAILEIADTHSTDDHIRARESYWKTVLRTRKYGNNSN